MELSDEKLSIGKNSFVKHVFNFDQDTKSELLNIVQYSLVSVVPIILLNKSMHHFSPELDESKGSFEVLVEIVLQIIVMFVGIFFIHRIITYIPTYSGIKYENFSVVNIIIVFLMILLSLQSKLGEKTNLLIDRLVEYIDGSKSAKVKPAGGAPLREGMPVSQLRTQQLDQSGYVDNVNYGQTPAGAITANPAAAAAASVPTYPVPNFDKMYAPTDIKLPGANTPQNPHMSEDFAPMAASDAFGSSFGSLF
jgi:hypothetical protein